MKLINGLPAQVYQKQWRLAHPEQVKEYTRRAYVKWGRVKHEKYKNQVYNHYKAICVCCGETNQAFLSLDHINNDGAHWRQKIGRGRDVFYLWIIKNNFPTSLQVLCMNCQWSKRKLGTCPHQTINNAQVRGLNG